MITKEIRYSTPQEYLQDYEQHLRHGGLLIHWTPAPALHSVVELILYIPPDQTRVRIKATVVTPTPNGVGVQFEKFGTELRATLEQNASVCRNIVNQMSQSALTAAPAPTLGESSPPAAYPASHSGGFAAVVGSGEHAAPTQSGSGSWLTLNPSLQVSPPAASTPSQTALLPVPNIHIDPTHARTFAPSPEDWNRPDLDISQDVLWSNSEIPVPSDLHSTQSGEDLPTTNYSSPEIDSPFVPEETSAHVPVMRYPSHPSMSALPASSPPSFQDLSAQPRAESNPSQPTVTTSPSSSHIQSWLTREPVRSSRSYSRMPGVSSSEYPSSSSLMPPDVSGVPSESAHSTADDSVNLPAFPHTSTTERHEQGESSAPRPYQAPVISPPPGSGVFAAQSSAPSSVSSWHPPAPDHYTTPLPRNVNRSAEQPSMHPSVSHLAAYSSQDAHLAAGVYQHSSHEFLSSHSLDHVPQNISVSPTDAIPHLSHEALAAYAAAYRDMQIAQKLPDTPSWTGTLSETPLLRVLNELSKRQATGLLEVETSHTQGEESLKTYLYQGKVLLVEEHPMQEDHLLGNILVKDGRINSQERENALKKSLEQLVPIGEVMTTDKIIAKRELSACLRKQMQKRLGRFTQHPDGSFRFWEKRLPRNKKLAPPTSPVKLLFRHKMDLLSEQPYEEARQLEDTHMDRYIFPAPDAQERLEDLGLLKEEMYFWESMVTGRFRLRQIYAASNFRHRRTYVLIFALHAFDFLHFQKEMAADWQIEEMRDFFSRRHGLLGEETFFELLGIHWTSSQKDIESAYKRIRRDYDIANYEGEWPQDIAQMSAEILAYLEKVHDQLAKGQDRREYRKDVLDDVKLRFSAELFEQQGDMAIYRRDFADAIERYERALELNPNLNHLREKIQQAKAGLKKFQEAIEANAGKQIDYQARMQIKINTETLFRPTKKE